MKERTKQFQKFLDDCAIGDFLSILFYVKSGNNFTGENNLGLSLAISHNHLEVTKYLMSKGANPFMPNAMPPIVEACENGHLKMVKYLWTSRYIYNDIYKDKSNKVGHKEYDDTIIFSCLDASLKGGYSNLINFFLDKGGKIQHMFEHLNVNNSNPQAYNGLKILCERGHLKALNKLVEASKVDIYFNNETHLVAAADNKKYEIVRYLLNKGCNRKLLETDKHSNIIYDLEKEDFAIELDFKIKNIIVPANDSVKKNKI